MVINTPLTVPCGASSPPATRSRVQIDWDINDTVIPMVNEFDDFHDWANGHCRLVYPATNEDAKKHSSGWAMRNTNNHNINILKKSCLGVLLCSANCKLPNGNSVHLFKIYEDQRFAIKPDVSSKENNVPIGKFPQKKKEFKLFFK
ncbi:Transcription factor glial cells missing [Lucilia cuprina]|nr:Transcription factor glial cells missing [Lucilia cuprina]